MDFCSVEIRNRSYKWQHDFTGFVVTLTCRCYIDYLFTFCAILFAKVYSHVWGDDKGCIVSGNTLSSLVKKWVARTTPDMQICFNSYHIWLNENCKETSNNSSPRFVCFNSNCRGKVLLLLPHAVVPPTFFFLSPPQRHRSSIRNN